ncbi:MAG: nuclear transport factor 2 family protein [Gemmataceae bacterium]
MSIQPAETHSFDEYVAIVVTLQPYIDAAKTGHGALMHSVWFDHARAVGSLGGNSINLNPDEFTALIDSVSGSPNAQSRIASIDYQGNTASARIEFYDWGGVRYTDFFVPCKQDGKWKISGKVYANHSRS